MSGTQSAKLVAVRDPHEMLSLSVWRLPTRALLVVNPGYGELGVLCLELGVTAGSIWSEGWKPACPTKFELRNETPASRSCGASSPRWPE